MTRLCPTCSRELAIRLSNTPANPGKHFVTCTCVNAKGRKYFTWIDLTDEEREHLEKNPPPPPQQQQQPRQYVNKETVLGEVLAAKHEELNGICMTILSRISDIEKRLGEIEKLISNPIVKKQKV